MIRRLVFLALAILSSVGPSATPAHPGHQTENVSAPDGAAIFYSELEAAGDFSSLYTWLHPDARAIVPEAAVVGWYSNEFAPNGPGVITVTGITYTTWTWEVTGTTYPNTAVVSFQQPFANGTVIEDVVRLVESDGAWRWFFGRSREFVDAQVVAYGSQPLPSGQMCTGAAEWWAETYPRTFPASYFSYVFPSVWNGGNANAALLQNYADSFTALYEAQASSSPPPAATDLQAQLLSIFDAYARGSADLAAVIGGNLNPLAESGALSAGIRNIDNAGASLLSLDRNADAFLSECDPIVVFVFGMGEDLPVGVLPGQSGLGVPAVECSLFESQQEAQRFFEAAQPGDPHGLDSDGNGIACDVESAVNDLPAQESDASVSVTPTLLRVSPGGSTVYVAQPLLWGDWSSDEFSVRLTLRFPADITVADHVICGARGASIPATGICDVQTSTGDDGSTTVTSYMSVDIEAAVAVHVPVVFSDDATPGSTLRVHVAMQVSGGGPVGNSGDGGFQTVYATVVEDVHLDVTNPAVAGRIEHTGSYTLSGDVCASASGPWDMVFYEWGADEVVARIPSPSGYVGSASDGLGQDACVVEFAIGGLSSDRVYSVARVSPGETSACRACYIGAITPGHLTQTVFRIE